MSYTVNDMYVAFEKNTTPRQYWKGPELGYTADFSSAWFLSRADVDFIKTSNLEDFNSEYIKIGDLVKDLERQHNNQRNTIQNFQRGYEVINSSLNDCHLIVPVELTPCTDTNTVERVKDLVEKANQNTVAHAQNMRKTIGDVHSLIDDSNCRGKQNVTHECLLTRVQGLIDCITDTKAQLVSSADTIAELRKRNTTQSESIQKLSENVIYYEQFYHLWNRIFNALKDHPSKPYNNPGNASDNTIAEIERLQRMDVIAADAQKEIDTIAGDRDAVTKDRDYYKQVANTECNRTTKLTQELERLNTILNEKEGLQNSRDVNQKIHAELDKSLFLEVRHEYLFDRVKYLVETTNDRLKNRTRLLDLNNIRAELLKRATPYTVRMTVSCTCEGCFYEQEERTAESLKASSISMRNVFGDFIK